MANYAKRKLKKATRLRKKAKKLFAKSDISQEFGKSKRAERQLKRAAKKSTKAQKAQAQAFLDKGRRYPDSRTLPKESMYKSGGTLHQHD